MIKSKSIQLIFISMIFCLFVSTYLSAQDLVYFGQDPPGMTPVRFPPASLLANGDWFWHGSPNFSPDLMEMYWGKYSNNPQSDRIELAFVEVDNSQWTQMQTPSFADLNYHENNPCFSNSGDTLYFLSRKPEGYIFYVSRTPTGWSQPVQLDIPLPTNKRLGWDFSITKDKSIYIALFDINGSSPPDIYKTSYVNGQYTMPETIGSPANTNYNEFWPYIDPDERFLIFISNRPGGYGMHDLYLSSRNQDGTWNDPINLGPEINSNQEDGAPYISPDGLYFFFTAWKTGDLGYNPYWIDAQVVYDLRTDVLDDVIKSPAAFQLNQNYPNPFNPTTIIKYQIPEAGNVKIVIYNVLGQAVKILVDEELNAGNYEVIWDGRDDYGNKVGSGVYVYRMEGVKFSDSKKFMILK